MKKNVVFKNNYIEMKSAILVIILSLIFSSFSDAKDLKMKPCSFNCASAKNKNSPWKFKLDFEDDSWKKILMPHGNGVSFKQFQILDEQDGNKYLAITVSHGIGRNEGSSGQPTERAEIHPEPKQTFGKEIWYGFRVKVPKTHQVIADRLLISQFKIMQKDSRPMFPAISIKNNYYEPKYLQVGYHFCTGSKNSSNIKFGKNIKTTSAPLIYCKKHGKVIGIDCMNITFF